MRLERGKEATIERAFRSHPGAERFEAEIARDGAQDRFRRWTLDRIVRAEKQDARSHGGLPLCPLGGPRPLVSRFDIE
jgi:hypothetical protein